MGPHEGVSNEELAALLALLLMEAAMADQRLLEGEVNEILSILKAELNLSEESVNRILNVTLDNQKPIADILPHLNTLGLALSEEQREHILDLVVKVARIDDRLSTAEEDLVLRTGQVLRLSPDQIAEARARAS